MAVKLPPLGDRPRGSRAGVVPLHPTPRHRARGCSWDMQFGREATAARRQASRLAGLVWLPVYCRVKTAIRRRASWLAIKASVKSNSRWPFALQKYPSYTETSQPTRSKPALRQLRGSTSLFSIKQQNSQTTTKHPTLQGVSMPTADCGGEERR